MFNLLTHFYIQLVSSLQAKKRDITLYNSKGKKRISHRCGRGILFRANVRSYFHMVNIFGYVLLWMQNVVNLTGCNLSSALCDL